jgi:dienelactone hydrolase
MKRLLIAVALFGAVPVASAAVQTRQVEYKQGETVLQGYLAWDDAVPGKRPGVLVVHEWWGHNQHARNQAKRLAEAGYVGFALDMFGKGKLAKHPEDAQAFVAEATKDPVVVKARFLAALELLKQDPHVDPERIAAFGYCFGGAVALGMARQGVDLDAVVTFHGALATQAPAHPGAVKARLLILNGADDPMIAADQLAAFKKEMDAAGARYEIVNLAGARHSFTNPDADQVGMEALAYNAEADRLSWQKAMTILAEAFGK